MTTYHYQARNKAGEIYENTVEASDKLAIYKIIREEGGTVVMVKEVKAKGKGFSLGGLIGGIKTQEKINFAKNLAAMIEAGLPVTRALSVMEKQAKSKALKSLLADVAADLNRGDSLAQALGKRPKVFSSLFISMVKAGEESGSVAESLKIVASQMEKSYLLIKKVRGAMIYPAVIITVMIVIGILLLIFMVPTLTATFSGLGVQLPLPTRILIASSDFLVHHTLVVLGALLALALGAAAFLRSERGKRLVDSASIRLPLIGEMVKEVQAARTTRTLSSLLSAGVDIVEALSVTEEVLQNHLYKEVIDKAHGTIQKGESLSDVFGEYPDLYPAFVSEMSAVGEETGKIAEMLMGVASYYENQVDEKTKDLSTIIEPVLMVLIGFGVGIFAISMLAPTYSLVNYIN